MIDDAVGSTESLAMAGYQMLAFRPAESNERTNSTLKHLVPVPPSLSSDPAQGPSPQQV